ncbi:hypothetical protein D9615_000694 [Tricholomella constricta]|uniref:Uncharacterized protein n=1 Tax=Tricholomella constricta TaxID=117010 RepID=A0A8H5HS19_9AGAR|nr:hypothetical protein D9615_000694 [Tricholomella constricta]
MDTLELSMVAWVAMEDIPASLRSSPDFQGLDDDFSMTRESSELSLAGKDGFTALPPVSTFLMYGVPTGTLPKLGTIVQRLSESLEHLTLEFLEWEYRFLFIPAEVLKVKYATNLYSLTLLDGLPEDLHLLLQQCQHAHLNEVAWALPAYIDRPDMLRHNFWKSLDSFIMDPKTPFRLSSLTLGFYDWCPIQLMAETTKSVCLPLCAAAGIIQVVSERDYPFNTRRRMEVAKPTQSGKNYGSLCSVGAI